MVLTGQSKQHSIRVPALFDNFVNEYNVVTLLANSPVYTW